MRAPFTALLIFAACAPSPTKPDLHRASIAAPPAYAALQDAAGPAFSGHWIGEGVRFASRSSRIDAQVRGPATRVAPMGEPDAWFELHLRGVHHGGAPVPLTPVPEARLDGHRARLRHSATIEEWFVHGPAGLQHGFTLATRPSDGDGLALELDLAGPGASAITVEGGVASIHGARLPARYGGLFVHDAAGRSLPARIERRPGGLRLRVDDHRARYPITVDPLLAVGELILDDPTPGGWGTFGGSLALDTRTLVVADPGGYGEGQAHVYQFEAGSWALYDSISSEADPVHHDGYGPGDLRGFGSHVAADDGAVVVGGEATGFFQIHEDFGLAYGRTHIYFYQDRPGRCGWPVGAAAGRAAFGCAMLMTDTMGLGLDHGQGAFAIRQRDGAAWTPRGWATAGYQATGWGEEMSMGGDLLVAAGNAFSDERVNVLVWNGTNYARTQLLPAPIGVAPWLFGEHVATDGERVAVTYYDDNKYYIQVHERPNPTSPFAVSARIPLDTPNLTDLALDGDTIAVGDPDHEGGLGGVHLYRLTDDGWKWQSTVMSGDPQPDAGVGSSLSLDDDFLAAGSRSGERVHLFALALLGGPDGQPCEADTECDGFCVDGVCCAELCGGNNADDCLVCAVATGASADGVCTPLAEETVCAGGACRGGECLPPCGDGECATEQGENCNNCANDCGTCCGNGRCDVDLGESCEVCEADCGSCCGNGQLELGEFCDGADLNEMDCAALTGEEGTLACATDCTYDTRGCGEDPGDSGDTDDTGPSDACTAVEAWGIDLGNVDAVAFEQEWKIGFNGANTSLAIRGEVEPASGPEDACVSGSEVSATVEVCVELGGKDCYAVESRVTGTCEAQRSCTQPPVATCSESVYCCEEGLNFAFTRSKVYTWDAQRVARYTGGLAKLELEGELALTIDAGLAHAEGRTCDWIACPSGQKQSEYSGQIAIRGEAAGAAALEIKLFGTEHRVSASTTGCAELSGEIAYCPGTGLGAQPGGKMILDAEVGEVKIGWFEMSQQDWELVRWPADAEDCE